MKKQDEATEKKSDSRKTIKRLTTVALIIILILLLTRCQACGNNHMPESPEITTEPVTEATETVAVTEPEVTEAVETEATEPEEETQSQETEPEAVVPSAPAESKPAQTEPSHGEDGKEETKPAETQPSHKHDYTKTVTKPTCTDKGYTTYKCACGDSYTDNEVAAAGHNYKTEVVAPSTSAQGYTLHTCSACGHSYKDSYTEKLPVETQPEQPKETEPPVPEETEPVGCQHSWQKIDHPEVGHEEGRCVCVCGYRCASNAEWTAHVKSYSMEDALLYHTSFASSTDYVVDTPAYTEWVCSKCGAATTAQP